MSLASLEAVRVTKVVRFFVVKLHPFSDANPHQLRWKYTSNDARRQCLSTSLIQYAIDSPCVKSVNIYKSQKQHSACGKLKPLGTVILFHSNHESTIYILLCVYIITGNLKNLHFDLHKVSYGSKLPPMVTMTCSTRILYLSQKRFNSCPKPVQN